MDQQSAPSSQQPVNKPASTAPKSSMKVYWIAGVVVVVAGLMWYVLSPKTPSTNPTAGTNSVTPTVNAAHYKDGTYTADGNYMTHAGPETVTITLTLKGDMITDSQFQGTPNASMSGRYMDIFSQNYKQYVVGKNINDVQLSNVSGSSLTPQGFNDALAKIKAQAAS